MSPWLFALSLFFSMIATALQAGKPWQNANVPSDVLNSYAFRP